MRTFGVGIAVEASWTAILVCMLIAIPRSASAWQESDAADAKLSETAAQKAVKCECCKPASMQGQLIQRYKANQGIPVPGTNWSPSLPMPEWMAKQALRAEKQSRVSAALHEVVDAEYLGLALREVFEDLEKQTRTNILINYTELDLLGVDPDAPITFQLSEAPLGSVLNLILDPLELTFQIKDVGLLVTSKDAAKSEPSIRYYDLAWVLEQSDESEKLINAIETTIHPDSWLSVGGTSSIQCVGSILIVAAPDSTQRAIESMFGSLSRFKKVGAMRDEDAREAVD